MTTPTRTDRPTGTTEDLAPYDWRRARIGLRHQPVTEEMMQDVESGEKFLSEYTATVASYINSAKLYDRAPLDGQGFLYAVEVDTTFVKVGQTITPRRRILQHHRDANVYKLVVTRFWLSPPHWGYLDNEVELIAYCAEISARARKEYFHDIGIGAAAMYAADLAHHSMLQGAGSHA